MENVSSSLIKYNPTPELKVRTVISHKIEHVTYIPTYTWKNNI